MGCLVGNVAQFKNQNEVNHLPLELSADEVTLAVSQGWVELFPETAAPIRAAAARVEAASVSGANGAQHASASRRRDGGGGGSSEWDDAYHEYYSQFDPRVGFTGRFLPLLGPKRRKLAERQQQQQQQQQQARQQAQQDAEGTQPPQQQQLRGDEHARLASMSLHGHGTAAGAAAAVREAGAAASSEGGGSDGGGTAGGPDLSEPGWQAAVAEGGAYTIPMTAAAAAAARAGRVQPGAAPPATGDAAASAAAAATAEGAGGVEAPAAGDQEGRENADALASAGSGAAGEPAGARSGAAVVTGAGAALGGRAAAALASDGGVSRVGWAYPATDYERLRFAVFADLHRQGFMMTGGIKFGSDMLAYPGDPSLYHAQFTVRPVPPGQPLNPMVLKAVARGSHAARKHLLLAFHADAEPGAEGGGNAGGQAQRRIKYLSFAPEAGFGHD